MKPLVHRYRVVLVAALLFVLFLLILPVYQAKAIATFGFQAKIILLVIPPIFVLLGLLDVWVPREQMIRFMGEGSGLKGGTLAFLLGSFAAGPLYAAFPVAAILMKKGAGFTNILIFIGAWSTTKIPMFLFENAALGSRFAFSRLAIDIIGIILIAMTIVALVSEDELQQIYTRAEKMGVECF